MFEILWTDFYCLFLSFGDIFIDSARKIKVRLLLHLSQNIWVSSEKSQEYKICSLKKTLKGCMNSF